VLTVLEGVSARREAWIEWEQRESANNSAFGIEDTFMEVGCNCLRA